jgi:hypothetical protein
MSLRKLLTERQTGTEVMTDNSYEEGRHKMSGDRKEQGDNRHWLRKGPTERQTGTEAMTDSNYEEGRHNMSGDREGARRKTGTA